MRIDLCNRGHQTLQQRFLGHFQAEHRYRHPRPNRNIFRQIQRQRGFPLRWACRKNNQFRRLQAGKQLVQLAVTRGNSGDAFPFAKNLFQALEIVANQVLDGNQPGLHAIFGQRKNAGLRAVQYHVRSVFAFQRALLDLVRGVNQVAQQRLLSHDPRVVVDVRYPRHPVHQRCQVRRPARRFQFPVPVQFFRQRHQVDSLLRFRQRHHLREHIAMLRQKEVFGFQGLDGGVQRVVVQDDGAEDGALRVNIARQRFLDDGISRHDETDKARSIFAFSSLLEHFSRWKASADLFFRCLRSPASK